MGDEPTPVKPSSPEQDVFTEAIRRLTPEARTAYLDAACGTDTALRRRVEALLRAAENAGDFLEQPPTGLAASEGSTIVVAELSEKPGDKIGRYKLLEQIGEGGCGVVYMAEQEEPVRRRVALKVIKLGMDTRQVIARFEAERQALAMMDHPNIAKVHDGGVTDTGRPFFVMELVRGIKITDYCDQNNLSTNERLELFIQVCQAIQHAHQKGVIHRDIKPSNILVTHHDDVAVPKVIDFGIAKATIGQLTDKTVFTAFAQFMGTPAYMSPEQAQMSGLDVDTRADIYSLGVLLYELLTGHTPFDAKELLAAGLDEMRRKIREDEPAKPSTRLSTMLAMDLTTVARNRHVEAPRLIHLVRGDLDWLVMKCLEKDRTRRYETANGLAMDLQRHLDNEPVVARPPTNLYRFQKLVRRNKLAFAASAAVLLVLLGGIAVSTWQAIRATRAEREQTRERAKAEANEKKAESEATKSQRVAQFLQDMLKSVGPSVALGRDTTMVREILDQTAQRLDDLTAQPAVEADLRSTLGNIYSDLGEYTNAAAMQREALGLRKKLLGGEHPDVATSLNDLAETLYRQGNHPEAQTLYREALALRKKLFGSEHPHVAQSLNDLAEILRRQGQANFSEAELLHREALTIRRKVLGSEHSDVAQSLQNFGMLLADQRRHAEAEVAHREALAIWRKLLGNEHPDVAIALDRLGSALEAGGKNAEAEAVHREALALLRQMLGKEHPEVARSLNNLGRALRKQRKYAEAEAMYREALAMRRRLLDKAHPDVTSTLRNLGLLFRDQGKLSEAETLFREVLALRSDAGLEDLTSLLRAQGRLSELDLLYREELATQRKSLGNEHIVVARSLQAFGWLLREQGKLDEAETNVREALAIQKKLLGAEHADVAFWLNRLGDVLREQRKWVEAEVVIRESLAMRRKLFGNEHQLVAVSLGNLALVFQGQGKLAEAEKLHEESIQALRQKLGEPHPALGDRFHAYGEFLRLQSHKPDAAVEQFLKALPIRRASQDGKLASTLCVLGHALIDAGNPVDAEQYLQESVALGRKLGRLDHEATVWSLQGLAAILTNQKRFPEVEAVIHESLTMGRNLYGNEHPAVAHSLSLLGGFVSRQGKHAEAEALHREALQIRRKLPIAEQPWVANSLNNMAHELRRQGKAAEAEAVFREAVAFSQKMVGDKVPDSSSRLADSLSGLALALKDQGKLAEAKTAYHDAAEHAGAPALNEMAWTLATAPDPKLRDGPSAVTFAEKAVAATNRKNFLFLDTLAAAYAEIARFTNAVVVQQEAIALLQDEKKKNDYTARLKLYELKTPYRDHNRLAVQISDLLAEGKFADAEPLARECLALREKLIPDHWLTFNTRSVLGGSLIGQKKFAEAQPLLLSGYEGMKQRADKIPAIGNVRVKETLQRLVQLYEATGQSEKAAEWNKKLAEFDKAETEKKASTARP